MIVERNTAIRLEDGTVIPGGGTGLRMTFDLRAGITAISRPSLVSVYNITQRTTDRMTGSLWFDVGDETLYAGSVSHFELMPVDAVTTRADIELQDGNAIGAISTLPGARGRIGVRTLVSEIARVIGVGMGASTSIISDSNVVTDYSYSGPARDALTQILATQALQHYIEFGLLQVVRPASPQQALDVSERTGMIGIPTRTDTGYEVRVRLTTQYRLDSHVTLRGDGDYKISTIRHRGDTWEGAWETMLGMVSQ